MVPVPMDWAIEIHPPAKFYQQCLPQVLRYMNTVTNTESELMAVFNGSVPTTTDHWDAVHIQSMTGEWDYGKEIIKATGFDSVIVAEHLAKFNGGKEFPSTFGYFDTGSFFQSLTVESLEHLWKYVDYNRERSPKNRMYLSWKDSATHTPLILPPEWKEKNYRDYLQKSGDSELWRLREHLPLDTWLNAVKWTDDIVEEIILGFRERGLEDETLFLMYTLSNFADISHGDHGIPFLGEWRTPVNNPHNEPYRTPFMIYNPRIKNPQKQKVQGNFYALSIPTTVLDLMVHTNSFEQEGQKDLALRFAGNYEHAQSLLRPITETIRFFTVDPGGNNWIVDNGRNLRVPLPSALLT
jgi:Sulfatase